MSEALVQLFIAVWPHPMEVLGRIRIFGIVDDVRMAATKHIARNHGTVLVPRMKCCINPNAFDVLVDSLFLRGDVGEKLRILEIFHEKLDVLLLQNSPRKMVQLMLHMAA